MRTKELTHQIVVRVEDELREALEADAEANGRTVAQSVRWLLNSLADDSDCRFDHHGGCQEHGYLFHERCKADERTAAQTIRFLIRQYLDQPQPAEPPQPDYRIALRPDDPTEDPFDHHTALDDIVVNDVSMSLVLWWRGQKFTLLKGRAR
jgi:hypothetical protein